MIIFRLDRDTTKYMYFTFDLLALMPDFGSTVPGEVLDYDWEKPVGRFHSRTDEESGDPQSFKLPDITQFEGPALIINDAAKKILEPVLKDEGGFYEVNCDGSKYWYFNPTICKDNEIIDLESSELVYAKDPRPPHVQICLGVCSMVFNDKAGKINENVFLVDFDGRATLYCTDKFKKILEENDFQGMLFSEDYIPVPCEATQEDYEEALQLLGLM